MAKKYRTVCEIKNAALPILRKNGVVRAGIFGSYARGEQTSRSDIDMLIEFKGSLMDLVGIEQELGKELDSQVDLLTYKGIHPLLREKILKEEVRIL